MGSFICLNGEMNAENEMTWHVYMPECNLGVLLVLWFLF